MWEDNTARIIIRNIILAILSLAVIFCLFKAISYARKKTAEEDAVLMDAYQQQQQQQSAERKEKSGLVDQVYQEHLNTLNEYLPGIVCWGDMLTSGNSGNVSYPDVLKAYIDANICDIYDLSYSLDANVGLSRVEWDKYTIDVPVVNMGGGHENTYTIMGRAGVIPFVVSKDFTIPAGTDKVQLELTSEGGQAVNPLVGGTAGVNNVFINGIEGVLSVEAEAGKYRSYSHYYFNRLEPGKAADVPAGTPIITDATDKYKDYIHIIFIGTYGKYSSPSELVEQVRMMLARQTKNTDRFLVIGICASEGKWFFNSNYFNIMDSAMIQAFGDRYVNFRKYLCSDGLADAGLPESHEDNLHMQAGVIPSVFKSNAGDTELTAEAYKLLGQLVYERMDKLGYFDEVKTGLKIDLVAQQLEAQAANK